ncbi:MAG: MotA/TolQ/ExbB proton channel family protein, partial [Epsilonproteobacteria bacterium]|nr:MotA/TolQ/ExbB proton channel family protein [Campylobacterota bacterium]
MIIEEERSSCMPNFLVILSAPFLVFLAAVISYFGYLSLKVEIHTLATIGLIFFIFIFFIKHNANYVACKFKQSFEEIEDNIKLFLKENSFEIDGKKKSLANIDDILDKEIKELRNDNFASVAPTVFPMLGILGTFIAIAISMPDFSVQSADALDREITLLLSGVGTAFYASIYGIFLSLWWIFFEKRGLSKLSYTIEYIKKLYSKYIWDKYELERYKLSSELESAHRVTDTLKEIFNIDMIKSLNQRYIEDFQIIVDKT